MLLFAFGQRIKRFDIAPSHPVKIGQFVSVENAPLATNRIYANTAPVQWSTFQRPVAYVLVMICGGCEAIHVCTPFKVNVYAHIRERLQLVVLHILCCLWIVYGIFAVGQSRL